MHSGSGVGIWGPQETQKKENHFGSATYVCPADRHQHTAGILDLLARLSLERVV